LTLHGGHPSHFVGDAQGASNLEGPTGTQVEELWLQHNFKGSGASLLVGIYDLNSEFYRLQAAGLFVNSAFGIGPEFAQSGVEGPSIFPRTSAGLRLALKPTADTVLRAAVLDGVPLVRPDGSHAAFRGGDGLLIVGEFAMLTRPGTGADRPASMRDRIGRFSSLTPYDDKLAIGAWHYSGRFADLVDTDGAGAPLQRNGSSGAYVVAERLLLGGGASTRHVAAFMQAGVADARTNRFGAYLGAGIVASGWGPARDSDQLGVAVARHGRRHLGRDDHRVDLPDPVVEVPDRAARPAVRDPPGHGSIDPQCLGLATSLRDRVLRSRARQRCGPVDGPACAYSAQWIQPCHHVSSTTIPNAIRYHANGTKLCVAM